MAQSPANSGGDGEKIEPPQDSKAADKNLPMVLAPKLGAGEDEAIDETPGEGTGETAAAAAPKASPRFLMLAATVAFAAAFGSFVGSVSGTGFVRFSYPPAPAPAMATASNEAASDTLRAVKQQLAELSTIKTNLDSAAHNATSQFAKLADRLDKIDQHTASAAETTGSIAAVPPPPPAPPGPPKLTERVLPDWVVQDVRYGRALVESSRGRVFEVGAGSVLPGLGRVGSIKRQDGQWIVLTESGTITSTGR